MPVRKYRRHYSKGGGGAVYPGIRQGYTDTLRTPHNNKRQQRPVFFDLATLPLHCGIVYRSGVHCTKYGVICVGFSNRETSPENIVYFSTEHQPNTNNYTINSNTEYYITSKHPKHHPKHKKVTKQAKQATAKG